MVWAALRGQRARRADEFSQREARGVGLWFGVRGSGFVVMVCFPFCVLEPSASSFKSSGSAGTGSGDKTRGHTMTNRRTNQRLRWSSV